MARNRYVETVVLSLAAALVLALAGSACATRLNRASVLPEEARTLDSRSPYLKVHMKDAELYVLSTWRVDEALQQVSGHGERFSPARESRGSGPVIIPIAEVALFETNVVHRSPSVAVLAVVTGVSAAVTAFCITNPKACFGSCPTFYVSDGPAPRLVAEAFSSSVAPSLAARDVDALYDLRPGSRDLQLTMKNEALETHVVHYVRLLAARRPADGRVLQTAAGDFREVTDVRPVAACRADEDDCLAEVQAFDGHERLSVTDGHDLATREVVDVQFHPAEGAQGLVIASRQSLVSTYLFYQALAWLGRSASDMLAALERGDSLVGAALTRLQESIGGIEVLAETADGEWNRVAEVHEMGPLARDVVLVPLPPDATGRVRLRMARGHWRLDYLASARLGEPVEPLTIEASSIAGGRDVRAGDTLVTLPGDEYRYTFRLPADPHEFEYFLDSAGYYLEWMREEWLSEEDPARVAQLLVNPGQLLRDIAPAFKAQEAEMEALFWGSRYAAP